MSAFCGSAECADRVDAFLLDDYGRGTPCMRCLDAIADVVTFARREGKTP